MTGKEFSRIFDLEVEKAYSGYLDDTKKNRFFRKVLIESTEIKYRELIGQKQLDEISFLIGTNETFIPTNHKIYTRLLEITNISYVGLTVTVTTRYPHNLTTGDSVTISGVAGTLTFATDVNITTNITTLSSTAFTFTVLAITGLYEKGGQLLVNGSKMISDYEHLLAVKSYYTKDLGEINVIPGNKATITIASNNYNLRSGEYVQITGASTNVELNGYWYLKALSSTRFQLYSNPGLTDTIALIAEGAFPTIKRVFVEWCKPYWSDRKINVFETPTVIFPKVETANGQLKFYPDNETLSQVKLDYIKNPPMEIDVTNDVIDLEDYYPAKFLYYLINMGKVMFAGETRDGNLYQTGNNDIIKNP